MSKTRKDGRRGHRVNGMRAPRSRRLESYRSARLDRERHKEFQAEIIETYQGDLYDQMMEEERLLNEPQAEDFDWNLGDELYFESQTRFDTELEDMSCYADDDRYYLGRDLEDEVEERYRRRLLNELRTEVHAAVGRVVRRRGTVHARTVASTLATAFDVPIGLVHAAIDVLPYEFGH